MILYIYINNASNNIDSDVDSNKKTNANANANTNDNDNDKCYQTKLTEQNYLTDLTNCGILSQYKFNGTINSKTIIICRTLCFIVGALVEAYTYKLDPNNSMGLGWGLLAAIILF